MKKILGCAALIAASVTANNLHAANWLMLQGTESSASAPRAKVWGFIQPEFQSTKGTELAAGPWKGQDAAFNMIGPDLDSSDTFQIRRARLGVRGTGFGLDSGVNRCQPWRAKRRLVVPSSREAALFSRRALRQRENKVGLRTRRPVIWEPSTEQ